MRANILIVEDDPDILSSLAEAIREEGFDVETAANGYQALTRLEAQQPDLIFLDLMMPLMDGWKFLEIARQRFPAMGAPVVLLSAVHNLTEEARRLGRARVPVRSHSISKTSSGWRTRCRAAPKDRARALDRRGG